MNKSPSGKIGSVMDDDDMPSVLDVVASVVDILGPATAEPEPPPEKAEDLSTLSFKQLVARAKEAGISTYRMTKAKIIEALGD